MKLEVLEGDYEQSQTDLRLAFKRISDLQTVIEDEMESGDDSDYRFVYSCIYYLKHLSVCLLARIHADRSGNGSYLTKIPPPHPRGEF